MTFCSLSLGIISDLAQIPQEAPSANPLVGFYDTVMTIILETVAAGTGAIIFLYHQLHNEESLVDSITTLRDVILQASRRLSIYNEVRDDVEKELDSLSKKINEESKHYPMLTFLKDEWAAIQERVQYGEIH